MTAPTAGRHRPTTVPSHWARPGERCHLARTDGFDWFTARHLPELGPYAPVPPFPPPGETFDVETTQDIPLPLGVLPAALAGPDPEPVQIDAWTGPLPIVAEPRDEKPEPVWIYGLAGFWGLTLLFWALLTISLAGG